MRSGRGAAKVIALVVYIIVILVATPQAQQHAASYSGGPGAMTAGLTPAPANTTTVDLLVGRSTILNSASPIARVSLTVPDIADALVTTPNQILVHGKTPGTISLFVWDHAGGITTYEVNVRRDLSQLIEQMKQLFPGEPISVTGSGKDIVIAGTVSTKYVIDKAADVASGYVEKKENVVNLLKQQEGVASNQVMLRVRFAEVSRSALQELGASFIANGINNQWFGRTTTQQFAAPAFNQNTTGSGLTFSDFLNVFLFNSKHDIGAVIRALQSKGLFESLAEPNLISLNGKEATFLAGGEYPYPIVQPGQSGNAITIQFKEFGIRLSFTPTVLAGDLISLHLRPEVSTLDFTNAIILDGFRVPALSTRRTETDVELQDGQTFAVAGLLNNTLNNTMQKIPGIGDVPVLGYLFKSRAYQKNQTELVVMITPQIIRRGSTGVSEGLPSLVEPYLNPEPKQYPSPAPYTGSPRYPANQSPKKSGGDTPAPQQPQAASQPATSQMQQPVPASSNPQPAANVQPATPERIAPDPIVKPQSETAPASVQDSKADPKALKKQQETDRKAAASQAAADKEAAKVQAAADKKAAAEKAAADKKQEEENAREQKLLAERSRREQEVAKKNAELEKKRQDDEKKQEKAIADAAARLKAAQEAYQAEIDKKAKDKGGQQ